MVLRTWMCLTPERAKSLSMVESTAPFFTYSWASSLRPAAYAFSVRGLFFNSAGKPASSTLAGLRVDVYRARKWQLFDAFERIVGKK